MKYTPRPISAEDISPHDRKRFWTKVDRSDHPLGCWIWTGTVARRYGRFQTKDRTASCGVRSMGAHRVSYALEHGAVPGQMHILHHCDNCLCVRPDHLYAGTHADNMADIKRKKRYRAGMNHYRAKVTDQDVLDIRRFAARGAPTLALSEVFDVTCSAIRDIVQRKTWKHL